MASMAASEVWKLGTTMAATWAACACVWAKCLSSRSVVTAASAACRLVFRSESSRDMFSSYEAGRCVRLLTLSRKNVFISFSWTVKNVFKNFKSFFFLNYDLAHLRHRADGMNLTNERAVGLKEQEKLEVQLVEPLTKLQLLEDIRTETESNSSHPGDTDITTYRTTDPRNKSTSKH